MATQDNSKSEQQNSDSEASFLSDWEEADLSKADHKNGEDQLRFVDSYFQPDQAASILTETQEFFHTDEAGLNVSVLPWERLAEWIHCFCVVTFDLEIGQMIEVSNLLLQFKH